MTEAERASNNSPKATEQMHPLQDPNDWVLVSLVLATPATCPGVLLPFLLLLSVFNPWTSHATSKSLPTPTLLPISSSIWPNLYFSKTSKTIMLLFGQLNCSGLLKKKVYKWIHEIQTHIAEESSVLQTLEWMFLLHLFFYLHGL